ncbi:hypothetical protein IGI04_007783 [Brassica rapa subsp. trilocularis]|uniref:Uncharacterized protein n=1 Tax=Brassica rapa subsp. trilocularis TaxID=1813537 RepID=A0ABQ7NHG4_BRACM|nr:hypothetical protein IGI04_006649 [Brassica rapa subsp. trilocularis]KAG5411464.1 hypothetical protein IGI04_007783 [Brassica rapa subsp. trilocularis]
MFLPYERRQSKRWGKRRSKRQRADGPSDGHIKMDSHGTSYRKCEERITKSNAAVQALTWKAIDSQTLNKDNEMENNRVSDGDVEMKSHREVMLDTIRPDLHVINNSERAISLKDDGPVTLKPNQAQEEASSKVFPINLLPTSFCAKYLIMFSAVNLSVHSNLIVNNIGPENTNRCDAAATIEGCSEVSEPNSLQTDPVVNTKEETTGADKGPNYKGS